MHEYQVGTLVIVDSDKRPVGIVTDRDLVIRVLGPGMDPHQTRVDQVMTRDPQTVTEKTPIEQALSLMRSGAFRRLPVVGHDGTLVGLVSLDDILGLLAEEFSGIGALLEDEAPFTTKATRFRGNSTT